ncbi:MAG: hypothetical protein GJU73_01645 [Ferrovum sp.]|jgi:hypothetical protein|uniref:hypothetical protein n=1 Tax=Ferrovum sp. TaxID=2609467 RepID=UPI002615D454|nr:hypothetical protein [Ferrovum sp.]MBW8066122.1 hypothetical protein [Ferrovum sp.]
MRRQAFNPRPTNYEIIRAKTLYAKHAHKMGGGVRLATPFLGAASTNGVTETVA